MDKIITVKAAKGINTLVSSDGQPISATLYSQDKYDREGDGKFVSEYTNKPLPGSKKYFSTQWDALRKQWSWGADNITFKDIVNKLRLRFPKGHPREGEIIPVEDVERHKADFHDPIFHHPELIGKIFIQDGIGTLNLDIALEAFMYHANKSLRSVVDETTSDEKRINPIMRSSATMVFSNPSRISARNNKKTNTFLDAMSVILRNQTNADRLKIFAELFDIPGIDRNSELHEIVPTLTNYVKDFGENVQKGSGYESLNNALVAHDKMEDDELNHRYIIKLAKRKGHIRTSKDGFILLGQTIDGPKSMDEIYLYFNNGGEKAGDYLVKLLDKMRELKDID